MTDPTIFDAARASLALAGQLVDKAEGNVAAVQRASEQADTVRELFASERAEHEHALANMAAVHEAKCAKREDQLIRRENALVVREREAEALAKRAADHETAVAHRAADLAQRYRGAA